MAQRKRNPSHSQRVHPTSGYTPQEELANSITHGIGLIWAVAALISCIVYASLYQGAGLVFASAVFGASLIALYLSSFLYHSVRKLHLKKTFLVLDHACIYLLIAGTYTPFALGPLKGPLGWTVFCVVWLLALGGVIRELVKKQRGGLASCLIYLTMGWLCLAVIVPLFNSLSRPSFAFLVAGGVLYSVGVVFYLSRPLGFHHAIWHLFVLAGSACHWLSVLTLLKGE